MLFDFCANGRSASLGVEKSERLTVEGLGSIQPRGSVSGFSVILKPLGSKDSKNKVVGSIHHNYERYRAPASAGGAQSTQIGHDM